MEIDVGEHFTRYPAGRHRSDGRYSGEAFREDYLAPALREHKLVRVFLDGPIGYGSSFLEEAFGGLVRYRAVTKEDLDRKLILMSEDQMLVREICEYISDAACEAKTNIAET